MVSAAVSKENTGTSLYLLACQNAPLVQLPTANPGNGENAMSCQLSGFKF